jgi:hypothetical protein
MEAEPIAPTYHVLLIGIDRYPPGYNSLAGCVNDIDAIEQLLLTPPGIGIPSEQICITRLAAVRPDCPSTSRFQAETQTPTKANFISALQALAGPVVKPSDRVLIYYSGHGAQQQWLGSSVWHEAMVPHNDHVIEYLFDVEINALIRAIAARTSDLTIVLDCCHSAGTTRDLPGQGGARTLKSDLTPVVPPDLAVLGLAADATQARGLGAHLLQVPDPDYLVIVACQSDETAGEGPYPPGESTHGVFTYSLLSVLGQKGVEQRTRMRWADIWPTLLMRAAERNVQLGQHTQHPWIIGRSEHRVFGGAWEKLDVGYSVIQQPEGAYEIGAGTLMSITEGAEIAVYGLEPRLFPAVGSPEDQPLGRLKVSQAGPSSARAVAVGAAFVPPEGARGRLVKPGVSARLRVSIKPDAPVLQSLLEASPLIEIVSSNAEVEVVAQPGGSWVIANDIEPVLAVVPRDEVQALLAGIEYYYGYNTVLRMAHNCNDLQLSHSLSVRLLDCNNQAALAAMSQEELADPNLPEATRDQARNYALPSGFKFCVKVTNSSGYVLNTTLLCCSSGGLVQYLSDADLRAGSAHVMWLDNTLRSPFEAAPDEMPIARGGTPARFVTDRLIAIGTTRKEVDLRRLTVNKDKTIQQVVDEQIGQKEVRGLRPAAPAAPAELWTATSVPVRIMRIASTS